MAAYCGFLLSKCLLVSPAMGKKFFILQAFTSFFFLNIATTRDHMQTYDSALIAIDSDLILFKP